MVGKERDTDAVEPFSGPVAEATAKAGPRPRSRDHVMPISRLLCILHYISILFFKEEQELMRGMPTGF